MVVQRRASCQTRCGHTLSVRTPSRSCEYRAGVYWPASCVYTCELRFCRIVLTLDHPLLIAVSYTTGWQRGSRKGLLLVQPTYPYLPHTLLLRGKPIYRVDCSSSRLACCRAQKMSHLTARPLAELHKLATSLEEVAFSKAQGNQVSLVVELSTSMCSQVASCLTRFVPVQEQYVNILSKRMKKLEANQSGLAAQQTNSAPQVQQPTLYQQPQELAHAQQLQLQQQAQQQHLLQQQRHQQQMLMQRSQQQQQQQHNMQAQPQTMASSAGSHDDEQFAQMSDVFGLYNSAATAPTGSQQPVSQAFTHAQAQNLPQQQQQAMQMPQIPRQVPDQVKQQQQQAQQQQRQYQQQLLQQQQMRQQQLKQQQQQQQQQLRLQQQQQLQQRQQQVQQQHTWQQPHTQQQQQLTQQAGSGMSSADSENQARMSQFWEVQGRIRDQYLYQLQMLHNDPVMRSARVSDKFKVRLSDPEYTTNVTTHFTKEMV